MKNRGAGIVIAFLRAHFEAFQLYLLSWDIDPAEAEVIIEGLESEQECLWQ